MNDSALAAAGRQPVSLACAYADLFLALGLPLPWWLEAAISD